MDALSGLTAAELGAALALLTLPPPSRFLVAVSGGPDSICLMHLMAALRTRPAQPPMSVAVVDHGLRAGSDDEADFVVAEAGRIGVQAHRLVWEGPKPTRAIQERARDARYGLLTGLCASVGASHLVTAHTLDDQAETVLIRLARGSGPAGLAAMRPLSKRDGVWHARPLLGVAKARLVDRCRAEGWTYRLDPSNADPRFTRARLRQLLPVLEAEGLNPARLAALATRAGRAEDALQDTTRRVAKDLGVAVVDGRIRLDAAALSRHPDEIVLRVIAMAVAGVGPTEPNRLERLEAVTAAFQRAVVTHTPFRRTLAGAMLSLSPEGILIVTAEGMRRRGRLRDGAR